MTDSLSQYCPNCETQANTIEELRTANERWVIAFKQAEERANGRIEALLADNAKLREGLVAAKLKAQYLYHGICRYGYGVLQRSAWENVEAINAALQETGQ